MPTCSCAHAKNFGSIGVNRRQENRFHAPSKAFTCYGDLTIAEKITPWHFEDLAYLRHRELLPKIKSLLDDKPPLTFVHLHINYKKLQRILKSETAVSKDMFSHQFVFVPSRNDHRSLQRLSESKKGDIKYDMLMSQQQELRMVDIERENRVMLDKMSYVYRTPPSLDNLVSEYNAYLLSVVKSLGRKRNERLFIRIAGANQWVFRRILETKTNYSNKKFLLQWRKNKQAMEHFSQYPVTFGPLAEPMYTPTKKPDKRYRKAFRPPAYEKATCPKKQHLPSRAQKSELAVVDDITRPRLAPKKTVKKPKPSSKPATKIKYAWMTTEESNEVIRASRAKKGEKYKDEGEEAKQQPKKNMLRALNKRSTVNSLIRAKLAPKVPHKVELRIPLTLPATNVLLKSYVKLSNEGNRKQNTKKTIRWATHKTKPEAKKNESVKNNKRKDGVETKTRNGEYNYSTGKIHEEKNGQTLFKKEKNGTSGYKDGSEETNDSEEDDEGKTDSEEDDEGKNDSEEDDEGNNDSEEDDEGNNDSEEDDEGKTDSEEDDEGKKASKEGDEGKNDSEEDDEGKTDSEEDDEGKKASKEDDEGKNDSEEDDEGNNDSGEDDEGKTDSEEDDEGKNYSEEVDEGKNDFEEDDEGNNDFEEDDKGKNDFEDDTASELHEAKTHD